MQLLPGLYQLSGTLSGLSGSQAGDLYDECNVYCLDLGDQLVLIDCGSGAYRSEIQKRMELWGLSFEKVSTCLITHPHYDHAGGAHYLEKCGIELVAHPETASALSIADLRCAGYLYHCTPIPATVTRTVEDRETFMIGATEFEAVHLPGHTAGCTVYLVHWAGEQVLFSGDVIGTLGWGHFGWDGSIDFNRSVYLQSLLKLYDLSFTVMLGGHGVGSFENPKHRVEVSLNEALSMWRR